MSQYFLSSMVDKASESLDKDPHLYTIYRHIIMTRLMVDSYSWAVAGVLQEHDKGSQNRGFWSQNGEKLDQLALDSILVIFVVYSS